MSFDLVEILLVVLTLSLLVVFIILPLLVWSFCQEAPRPSWQLGLGAFFLMFTPPFGVFFVLVYIINIVLTHKAREKNRQE